MLREGVRPRERTEMADEAEQEIRESQDAKKKTRKQYVSTHPDGGWQVKLEGSSKATKRFKTKAEAEEYAKELAKKQGTQVVRKKMDGSFQKKR